MFGFICKIVSQQLNRNHLRQTISESTAKTNSEYDHLAVLKCKTKIRLK